MAQLVSFVKPCESSLQALMQTFVSVKLISSLKDMSEEHMLAS